MWVREPLVRERVLAGGLAGGSLHFASRFGKRLLLFVPRPASTPMDIHNSSYFSGGTYRVFFERDLIARDYGHRRSRPLCEFSLLMTMKLLGGVCAAFWARRDWRCVEKRSMAQMPFSRCRS